MNYSRSYTNTSFVNYETENLVIFIISDYKTFTIYRAREIVSQERPRLNSRKIDKQRSLSFS